MSIGIVQWITGPALGGHEPPVDGETDFLVVDQDGVLFVDRNGSTREKWAFWARLNIGALPAEMKKVHRER